MFDIGGVNIYIVLLKSTYTRYLVLQVYLVGRLILASYSTGEGVHTSSLLFHLPFSSSAYFMPVVAVYQVAECKYNRNATCTTCILQSE